MSCGAEAMTKSGYLTLLSLLLFQLTVISAPPIPQFGEDNIRCLRKTKKELKDPNQFLYTWLFGNSSTGFICNFVGVLCWHNDDGKVLSIKLPGMTLEGGFPSGLKYCGSITYLDLSGNSLSGEIPKDLCKWLPYLVQLDLSGNQFSGPIPKELANCIYLNMLHLDGNQLSGSIPWELTGQDRLIDFNFANNMLTGQIPSKWAHNSTDLFQGNPGLCGKPFNRGCIKSISRINPVVVAAFLLYGSVAVVWTILGFRWWIWRRKSRGSPLPPFKQCSKARRSVKVCLFEKPIKKMRLGDLVEATDNFSEDKVIWCGRTGVVYKAELPDGSVLAVKRLRKCRQSAKEFKREMKTLAHLRHRNLVPLLGYCIADNEERLLVYKYIAKGTLLNCLHGLYRDHTLEWPIRVKICLGIARGLAWLHHSCTPHVVHRNISSGVVFLNEENEPRLSGFGLATFTNADEESCVSISSEGELDYTLVNEFRYDAPEQGTNIPSVGTLKGDVYSFGVVAFEVMTGLRPGDALMDVDSRKESTLIEWIRGSRMQAERVIQKYVVESEQEIGVVEELMEVAFRCVKHNPVERPSMYQAYECLTKIAEKYGIWDDEEEIPLVYAARLKYT